MDPSWEFHAPQFVDFNNLERAEDKKADEFFNVDMESGELWTTALEEADTPDSWAEVGPEVEENNKTVVKQTSSTTSDEPSRTKTVSKSQPQKSSSSLTFTTASIQQKTRKLANLVTSWSKGPVNKTSSSSSSNYTSSSSAASQPVKKRRRLSNAIVQSLASSSQDNTNRILRMTPRHRQVSSFTSYKSGSTPKRLGTNSAEPRLARNMCKKKSSLLNNLNAVERPKSAPVSASSKFFATIPKPFKLNTEIRAEERKIIDHRKREEDTLKEKLRQQELERRKRESETELLRYRQSLIHKARPVKQFRRLEIKRSEKMLTLPESPQLSRGTRLRGQLRSL